MIKCFLIGDIINGILEIIISICNLFIFLLAISNWWRDSKTVEQKFMGTTRTFIKPALDNTSAEISVDLSLNLRNGVDNYIYKLFKAWARLGYNINTGERSLKKDYCADWLKVSIANQAGDIYREIVFKDVMLSGPIEGMGEYDYGTADPKQITVKFKSDWWKETEL
jgi:hypothetical protein